MLLTFEIKVEKPYNFVAGTATWSQYKQSNTVKVMIAISPQGMIIIISDSWGGRMHDKYMTKECGTYITEISSRGHCFG